MVYRIKRMGGISMGQRPPAPPPDSAALNHGYEAWTEEHRLQEAVIPKSVSGPEEAKEMGHLRLTVDLLFKDRMPPDEERIMEVISAVSERILDLQDSLWDDPDRPSPGLEGQFIRYDGPVEDED